MKTIAQQINWDFEANGSLEIKNKNKNFINTVYWENSNGYWVKYKYNSQGKEIYYEDSNGDWAKTEYNSQGNQIYYENSHGIINDDRSYSCEDKEIEIDGVKYKLVKQ